VIRTRGSIRVRSDQNSSSEDYGASYGAAVVSDQAVAIGVTAVPIPTTDNGSDLWFVYEFVIGALRVTTAVGLFEGGHERIIDSKAMRKVEDGQDVIQVVEGPGTGIGSNGSQISGHARMLVKLH